MKLVYIFIAILIALAAAAALFVHLDGPVSATAPSDFVNSRAPVLKTARTKKCKCCKKMSPELRAIVQKHLKSK